MSERLDKERIFEKITTERLTERPFTTERKKRQTTINISRKGSIVKEKCRQLTNIVLELFPDRHVQDSDLTDLIQRYVGCDKETVRSYKGYNGFIKRSRYSGEGYIIGQSRKGYLELFGFMHRINRNEWVIHAQMKLPNADSEPHNSEGLIQKGSIEKISFSPRVKDTTSIEAKEIVISDKQYNNNNTERERNFTPKIFPKISLTPEEEAILNAKPGDNDVDLARKKCAKIQWSEG